MSERKGKKERDGNYPKCRSLLFSAEQEKRRLWGPSCWNKLMMYMFTRGCLAEKKEVRKNVCGGLRWVSFSKCQSQIQQHAIARAHQLMQEVHENRSTKLRLTGWKIKRVRVSLQSQLPHAHHFVTHTHFSMTLLRFSAKLPVEVWWEKSHWGREERSLVLWDTYIHTQGVDRSDIWSCLTEQEKSEKRRGKEKKGGEERRGKSLPGFHAFCLLRLSGFEEITVECLAC